MCPQEELKRKVKDRMRMNVIAPGSNAHLDPYSLSTNMAGEIQNAINMTVSSVLIEFRDSLIDAIVDEIYSDEKFETDIGLRE